MKGALTLTTKTESMSSLDAMLEQIETFEDRGVRRRAFLLTAEEHYSSNRRSGSHSQPDSGRR